jgi:hypothetical protein
VVAVSTLIRKGACGGAQHQHQQQQQQQCPLRGEQGDKCEKDTAITLAILLALETLLGGILIAFPKSRACITAALDLVRAIRIQRSPAPVVVVIDADVVPSPSAPQDAAATGPQINLVVPTPRGPPPPLPKREAPLAPRPTLQQQQQQQIENWCKKTTYIRDPSFTNLNIIIHLIKKYLIVGSLSVTKIIISLAIGIDLCSQL